MPTLKMVGKTLVYLDTSGVIAFLDGADICHDRAGDAWKSILASEAALVLTDYVRLECWSLLQRRLGLGAVEDFYRKILPLCQVERVSEDLFQLSARQILMAKRRKLSMVDLSSFECMERLGIVRAIAFDKHFHDYGFLTPDSPGW